MHGGSLMTTTAVMPAGAVSDLGSGHPVSCDLSRRVCCLSRLLPESWSLILGRWRVGAAVADADCGFEVEYRLRDGVRQRAGLTGCARGRLADAPAVRDFPFEERPGGFPR